LRVAVGAGPSIDGLVTGFSRRDPQGDLHASNRSPPGTILTPIDRHDPLDHPRPPSGRQMDGLPRDGTRRSMGPVQRGADRFLTVTLGTRGRALIWLGSG